MSDSSRHQMSQIEEVTYGTTPATPALDIIRHTGTTLGLTKDSSQSEEIKSDRQISCYRHGMRQVGGDISVEFATLDFDGMLEAVTCGTWDTGVLKTGVKRRSFSVLRHFTDQLPADEPFHMYTGCEYNTFNMSVTPNAIVTADFGLMGQNLALDGTAPTGASFGDPNGSCPFDGFSGVISEGGNVISIITEVSISLDNGLETRPVVSSDLTLRPSIGKSNLTGQITAYFENSSLLKKFIDETKSSLSFTLENADGDTYEFTLPHIVYTGGAPDVSGEGSITLSMPFQALYDGAADASLVLTVA